MACASQAVTGTFRIFLDQLRAEATAAGKSAEEALEQQIGDAVREIVGKYSDVEREIELALIQKVVSRWLARRMGGGGGGGGGGGR